jgi:hypothetical protein
MILFMECCLGRTVAASANVKGGMISKFRTSN